MVVVGGAALAMSVACEQPSALDGKFADGVTREDSAKTLMQSAPRIPQHAGAVVSGSITWTATPTLHQSAYPTRVQLEPITITFSGPAASVSIAGDGAISCNGTYGSLLAYNAGDELVAQQAMTLIDPADCGADAITFGAHGSVASSQGIMKLVIEPMSPMTFQVFGATGYATAYYTVDAEALQVTSEATCSDPTPTRGISISCSVTVLGGVAFTVLEQRATGVGFLIVETPNDAVEAGQRHEWGGGEAVATTEVTFTVSYLVDGNIVEESATATFEAQNRSTWGPLTLAGAPEHRRSVGPGMQDYPANRSIGAFLFSDPQFELQGTITTQENGPNRDLSFYNTPIALDPASIAWTHPGLYPLPVLGGRLWRIDQNGLGSGTCLTGALSSLAAMAERHEGVTQDVINSHWGIARQLLQQSSLHSSWEALYTSQGPSALGLQAENMWIAWRYGPPYQGPQDAFDAVDSPLIFGSLACQLDWANLPDL